jgi:hypothetical protein
MTEKKYAKSYRDLIVYQNFVIRLLVLYMNRKLNTSLNRNWLLGTGY